MTFTAEELDKRFTRPVKGSGRAGYKKWVRECKAYNNGRALHNLPLINFEEEVEVKYGHIIPLPTDRSADIAMP
jgi:hypothetical protein